MTLRVSRASSTTGSSRNRTTGPLECQLGFRGRIAIQSNPHACRHGRRVLWKSKTHTMATMLRLMRATLWTTVLCGCGTERAPLPELPKLERPLPDAVELLKPGVIADGKIVVQSLTGEPIEEIPLTTEFLARFSFRLVEPPPGGLKRIRVQLITYNSRQEPSEMGERRPPHLRRQPALSLRRPTAESAASRRILRSRHVQRRPCLGRAIPPVDRFLGESVVQSIGSDSKSATKRPPNS